MITPMQKLIVDLQQEFNNLGINVKINCTKYLDDESNAIVDAVEFGHARMYKDPKKSALIYLSQFKLKKNDN